MSDQLLQNEMPAVAAGKTVEAGQRDHWSDLVQGHMLQLDGLRGLAILLVLVYHFAARLTERFSAFAEPENVVVQGFLKLFQAGWIGVDLFFVLSGFLITGILCDTKKSGKYFSSFYLRRILRIFPLYYGFLLGALVLLPLLWSSSSRKWEFLQENQVWYWSYLTNWLCASKGDFNLVSAGYLWSLAVEEQFYMIWPFVVYFLSRRTLRYVCVSLLLISLTTRIVLAVAGVAPVALYTMTCTHLDPLVLGALLALAFRGPQWTEKHLRLFRTTALLSAAGLAALFLARGTFKFWTLEVSVVGILLLSLLFGYILIAALLSREATLLYKVLTAVPLRSFGRYSYAIYVFHPLIGLALAAYFNPSRFQGGTSAMICLLFGFIAVAAAVSWMAGFVSWHLYEKHFLKLKKYCSASKGRDTASESRYSQLSSTSSPSESDSRSAGYALGSPLLERVRT